jgi:TPR repeat protein
MRNLYRALLLVLPLALLASCAHPKLAAQQLSQAQQAYQKKDYNTSYQQMHLAAKNGNANAQYAEGYMLYYGVGIKPDQTQAIALFNKAANAGQPGAIKALHMLQHQSDASLYGQASQKKI